MVKNIKLHSESPNPHVVAPQSVGLKALVMLCDPGALGLLKLSFFVAPVFLNKDRPDFGLGADGAKNGFWLGWR